MNHVFEWRNAPAADFAVIGDPVAHSRSPQMHQAAYRALGLSYRYMAIRVDPGDVQQALDHLRSLGYRGVNVTVPHKVEALEWSSAPDEVTQRIGAANTLSLLDGSATNTDGNGFLDTLQDLGLKPGASALVLGAGGSARALAAVLPAAGYDVAIWNRTASRAESLALEFGIRLVTEASSSYDVLINTTSAGLSAEELPIDWSGADSDAIAYDLVYGDTPFLQKATSYGMRSVDGKGLLVAQGARSFEWWLGVAPPKDVMMEAIL